MRTKRSPHQWHLMGRIAILPIALCTSFIWRVNSSMVECLAWQWSQFKSNPSIVSCPFVRWFFECSYKSMALAKHESQSMHLTVSLLLGCSAGATPSASIQLSESTNKIWPLFIREILWCTVLMWRWMFDEVPAISRIERGYQVRHMIMSGLISLTHSRE